MPNNTKEQSELEFSEFSFLDEDHKIDLDKWWDSNDVSAVTSESMGGIIIYCHINHAVAVADILNAGLSAKQKKTFLDFNTVS